MTTTGADATTGSEPGTGSTGGTGSSTGLEDNYYNDAIQPIFSARCSCHQGGSTGQMAAPYQNLSPGFSYDEIVGVASMQVPSLSRIEPGDPDDSYMLRKLKGQQAEVGGEGSRMPLGGVLDAASMQTLEDWVAAGAPMDM